MRNDETRRAHVDFDAPLKAYQTARKKGAHITVAPDDDLNHPATGNPCRYCQWRPARPVDDELGEHIAEHLAVFGRAERAHLELKALMSAELQALIDEAHSAGRDDLLFAIKKGATRGQR